MKDEEKYTGDLLPGTIIGEKYEILGVSGRGGMSTIYRARDRKVGRICAVKQIRDTDRESYERHRQSLLIEREMLAGLTNPRIPRITDIAEDEDGCFYVVMDFVEGETLQQYLNRNGPLGQEQVAAFAGIICDILRYLHSPEKGRNAVIFRDVKPGNIMLRSDGDLVLFDFGIAAELTDGYFLNEDAACTPGYAAPEQLICGTKIDQRVDIYGLGATMFALLTGVCPENAESFAQIGTLVPEIAPGLEEIIEKCTAASPEDRYQTCGELRAALDHWTEREADRRRKARRKLLFFAAAAAAAVVSFAAAGVSFYADTQQKRQNYSELISAADAAANDTYDVQAGKYIYDPQVVNRFLTAIDADPANKDGYMKMLDYCAAAGMPEVGLMRVTANIDSGVGGIDRNDELLFKVAQMYFGGIEVPGDSYREAAKYFAMVDARRMPIASYYQRISSVLGQYSALTEEDWSDVAENLSLFEAYLDSRSRTMERVDGYLLAAGVFRANEASFADVGTDACAEALRLFEKARADADDFLENADILGTEDAEKREAEEKKRGILQDLAALYLLDTPNRDLERSEACYVELLAGTADREEIKKYRFRLAVVYREMGDAERIEEWYAFLMEEYPEDPAPFLEYASYLYGVRKDAEGAAAYFKIAAGLRGAESVQSFRVLKNNLKNAGVL